MLDFKELHINFPFEPVREIVIERIRQSSIDQFLNQFN